ncbi:MAG TPA: DUF998 domain-containing protein [Gaiellaceae bacterium]
METVGAAVILVGLAVGVGALVALHLLPTGLSPLRDAVSRYGISDYALGYRVQTLGYALAGAGAAIGLAARPDTGRSVVVACVVFAVSRTAISWAPMDSARELHWLLAVAAFASVGTAARLLRHESHTSRVIALLMLAAFVAMVFTRRGGIPLFGLFERALYVCFTAWFVVVVVLLL